MDILIKKSRMSSWYKKKERGESFRILKRKLNQAALECDDLDLQAELKSFMYVDLSLRAKKYKLFDELNFKNVCS